MKFLVIGFSGIEMPSGFVPIAQELIGQRIPGATLERVGIGGISHDNLVHFIDRILDRHRDAEYLIYSISETNYRESRTDVMSSSPRGFENGWDEVEYLARAARARGIKTAFVNFPKMGYDYRNDKLEKIIFEVSRQHGLGYRSISLELQNQNVDLNSILIDSNHPNQEGSQLYAKLFVDFAEQLVADKNLPHTPLKGPFRKSFSSIRLVDLISNNDINTTKKFSRYGFEEDGYNLKQGDTILIDLGKTRYVSGFASLNGPKTGHFWIKSDDKVISSFIMYDQYCYYTRVFCWNTVSTPLRYLSITQDITIPDVKLLKGQPDNGGREMTLLYVCETIYGE